MRLLDTSPSTSASRDRLGIDFAKLPDAFPTIHPRAHGGWSMRPTASRAWLQDTSGRPERGAEQFGSDLLAVQGYPT